MDLHWESNLVMGFASMKRLRIFCLALTLVLLLGMVTQAQPNPLAVAIMRTDATSAAPNVNIFVSVVNEAQGQIAVTGLPPAAFTLVEEEKAISPTTVSEESVGLALVILMDRSGSMGDPGAAENQTRMDTQRTLVEQLINKLQGLQPQGIDLVGLIGFHEEATPQQELTHDLNRVFNTVDPMEFERDRNTSLFDTAGRAIQWLTDNTDPKRRAELQRMRKAILIFSDGTDTTSQTWRKEDVRDRALASGIPLNTVVINSRPGVRVNYPANPADLRWLAEQTHGQHFQVSTSDEAGKLAGFLDGLLSQRQQYHLVYPTQALKGAHPVRVGVTANNLTGEAKGEVVTDLTPPRLRIIEPVVGFQKDVRAEPTTPITITVEAMFPDNRARPLRQVNVFANGEDIGAAANIGGNHYRLSWLPNNLVGEKAVDVTLIASAVDSWLPAQTLASEQSVQIQVLPPAPPAPRQVWWLSGLVGVLALGLIVLLILLILTRRQIGRAASRVGSAATTALRSMTKPLSARGPAAAKLQIIRGPSIVAEYPIDRELTSVGRDPTRCEIILNDLHVSGLHFTIEHQSNDHYQITHQGSNPTEVNSVILPAGVPTPLVFGSKIKLGVTEMQFVQIGSKTVRI